MASQVRGSFSKCYLSRNRSSNSFCLFFVKLYSLLIPFSQLLALTFTFKACSRTLVYHLCLSYYYFYFTLVCFFRALPHPRVRVAVAEAMWQHHHGPQPQQQPNTTLPLALLHASRRPRDYLICRSFGRTFSRLVLYIFNPSSTQVPKI